MLCSVDDKGKATAAVGFELATSGKLGLIINKETIVLFFVHYSFLFQFL